MFCVTVQRTRDNYPPSRVFSWVIECGFSRAPSNDAAGRGRGMVRIYCISSKCENKTLDPPPSKLTLFLFPFFSFCQALTVWRRSRIRKTTKILTLIMLKQKVRDANWSWRSSPIDLSNKNVFEYWNLHKTHPALLHFYKSICRQRWKIMNASSKLKLGEILKFFKTAQWKHKILNEQKRRLLST